MWKFSCVLWRSPLFGLFARLLNYATVSDGLTDGGSGRFCHCVIVAMSSEAKALRSCFSKLVMRLQPDDIVDELFENRLLTQTEFEDLIKDVSHKSNLRGVN